MQNKSLVTASLTGPLIALSHLLLLLRRAWGDARWCLQRRRRRTKAHPPMPELWHHSPYAFSGYGANAAGAKGYAFSSLGYTVRLVPDGAPLADPTWERHASAKPSPTAPPESCRSLRQCKIALVHIPAAGIHYYKARSQGKGQLHKDGRANAPAVLHERSLLFWQHYAAP